MASDLCLLSKYCYLFVPGHIPNITAYIYVYIYIVGGLEHFYFSRIYGIILPIDKLHHISRWLLHHQPDIDANFTLWFH